MIIEKGSRIAVIGAGISGIAAASVLIKNGFVPVLFEKHEKIGGVWATAYPDVHLQNIFGETWWKDKGSGKYLQQIMSSGAEIDLSVFSKLDSSIFLKEIISV